MVKVEFAFDNIEDAEMFRAWYLDQGGDQEFYNCVTDMGLYDNPDVPDPHPVIVYNDTY